jgi:hypothetical protein
MFNEPTSATKKKNFFVRLTPDRNASSSSAQFTSSLCFCPITNVTRAQTYDAVFQIYLKILDRQFVGSDTSATVETSLKLGDGVSRRLFILAAKNRLGSKKFLTTSSKWASATFEWPFSGLQSRARPHKLY